MSETYEPLPDCAPNGRVCWASQNPSECTFANICHNMELIRARDELDEQAEAWMDIFRNGPPRGL